MKNRDVFEKSIETFSLENQGVAKVDEALDAQQQKTLRFELETFVCKGHYEDGLKRILEAYVETLQSGSEAPAAWVSGFFGSGKSHLVKVLRALWTNTPFPDGRTPRDIARLPSSVADALKEIDTLARQKKTHLLAASGTLSQGEGDSIRKAVLGIVFKACGLPSSYGSGKALMWLRNEGVEDEVRKALEANGRSLERELINPSMSTALQEAILAAKPGLARDSFELGDRLDRFDVKGDISQDDFIQSFNEATRRAGAAPIFLLVLDELQQYIADSSVRAIGVQEVIESLAKAMDGRVLVVTTGQSALADTPTLSKLLGRFSVPVLLSTSDVEEVLRETVLKKKASAATDLANLFSANGCLGEVSSHLRHSSFEHRREDEPMLGATYPLLPTRQRLWERVLGSTDTTGTGIQLRSQLRLAFDAVKTTRDAPLGQVIGGDFIYDEIRQRLRQANQISAEIANSIDELHKNGHVLKARALKAVFLLSRVITTSAADTGLKTDAQSIADLLVDHLNTDSAALRGQVRTALDELVDADRKLMRLAGPAGGIEEYRLQTKESADWFTYLGNEEIGLRNDPSAYESKLREELSAAVADLVRRITIPQGTSKQPRKVGLHTDPITAPKETDGLFVWLRSDLDGTPAKEVEQDAARAGLGCSIAFVHVGFPDKHTLVTAIVEREAATRTLAHFGSPKTPEGQEARNALLKQQGDASKRAAELLSDAVTSAQLFQGGGQAVDEGITLDERLRKAATDGAARLFNRFAMADAIGWPQAYQDAAKGLVDALKKIGHETPAETHPVAQEILTHIGAGSLKGSKLRDRFMGSPYGWSNEAVNAALAVLFAVGQLRVTTPSGQPLTAGKFLERDVNQYDFARENTPLSLTDKRAVARLTKCKPDDAESQAPVWVAKLKESFLRAAGTAPRPAPTLPPLLDELDKLAGKDLVKCLATEEKAAQQLALDLEAQEAQVALREPRWNDLGRLVAYLDGHDEAAALQAERQAVLDGRQLLANPDPVPPLIERAANALRSGLNAAYASYASQFQAGVETLRQHPDWGRLLAADQEAILSQVGLAAGEPAPAVGTQQELLASLGQCTPARWRERHDAIAGKLQQARAACAKKLEPALQHVNVPSRIVHNATELDTWLAEVRTAALAKLAAGPVQL
ncbi:MAG: BREX system P-loop protein BrxC [Burkholderiales bacterium]|nr:BREX system P-loop protein BrxC [Burkholderiales bacterium]